MRTEEELVGVALAALDAPLSDAEAWDAFDAKARSQEPLYQAAAVALFASERDSVAHRILDSVPSFKADDPNDPPPTVTDPYVDAALVRIAADYAPSGEYHRAWLERYRALIARTVTLGAREMSGSVGVSFSLTNLRARAAIQTRVTKLTGNVTQTTIDRIRETITQARTEGVGVSVIAKRIREDAFGGEITRARATTIARTETVGALNEGQYLGATEAGIFQAKRWLTQKDGRVRDTHQDAGAQGWISIAEHFGNGLRYPHEPGAPAAEVVNCRCTLLYSDLTPAQANRGSP